ncbi:dihydrolipoyl dehydrogenase [Alkalilimnicola ehrlichii]|uniref:Dihydrolipoyl dehydrogenase n=1 Tax=Alkalilimnicola ehrlichii TaxID=351052 RepID=A0A3E0WVZ8_9GAMM|nr:dihydrolipoyl dehydrogenase [Alkalilimnicola ehrlichii]RFA29262.1 dihydrolipoyl dehydrogenase [Alkalilimnicola ehrlichii]RFA36175.1 dihydrolipoyl dehydrogenase [Alkalilimnicola ehrlichii]
MPETIELRVPDIGDFDAVDVIEVLVSPGDQVEKEQSLITLESDKATMEVPASHAGTVQKLAIKPGDKVKQGDLIGLLEASVSAPATVAQGSEAPATPEEPPTQPAGTPPKAATIGEYDCDVVVIGAGPGGYTAAFRAADLGLKTMLIEYYPSLGGVCLNVGCIPSKALLHAAKVLDEASHFSDLGITFGKPKIDVPRLVEWKSKVVGRLTGGLRGLAKQRQVEVVQGRADFLGPHALTVQQAGGSRRIQFNHCIIAAGSRPVAPPGFDLNHPRIMDSTDALELEEVPKRLLVVGGGIIGLEMATVYEALGSQVTVVELADRLMVGADADLVKPLLKRIKGRYENIYLNTRVAELQPDDRGVTVRLEGKDAPDEARFDRVLIAIGRRPNSDNLNLAAAGLEANAQGFIEVDEFLRTRVPHIHAIGDIVGQPMLAHKAAHEGKIAAEVIAGHKSAFDARVIPSVAYTDPEVAWVGVTEEQAKREGLAFSKAQFPWAANGRSLSLDRDDGATKLLFDKATGRIIGGGIVGPNAGDLIAEIALAIEMGCEAEDIALTVHPHPTLSETVAMAAEAEAGTLTDLYLPRR